MFKEYQRWLFQDDTTIFQLLFSVQNGFLINIVKLQMPFLSIKNDNSF